MDKRLALSFSLAAQQRGLAPGSRLTQRIYLYADELYRVPSVYRYARTSQGTAHISHAGKDFVVRSGEWVTLGRGRDVALVSPLYSESVILELFE